MMAQASRHLQIPLVVTEQYPKGLGRTVAEIEVGHGKVFAKTRFSMLIPEISDLLTDKANPIKSVVLFGLEAHVCVLQTTVDLLEKGIDVHILTDGTSSMRQFDRLAALNRMRDSGAFLTTSESVLFQLVSDATHPEFKVISGLIKERAAEQVLGPDLASSL